MDKPDRATGGDLLQRVRCEFLEMPGLCLTEGQARRLWGLDAAQCSALLRELVDAKFLLRTKSGAFVHPDSATPQKVDLRIHARGVDAA